MNHGYSTARPRHKNWELIICMNNTITSFHHFNHCPYHDKINPTMLPKIFLNYCTKLQDKTNQNSTGIYNYLTFFANTENIPWIRIASHHFLPIFAPPVPVIQYIHLAQSLNNNTRFPDRLNHWSNIKTPIIHLPA